MQPGMLVVCNVMLSLVLIFLSFFGIPSLEMFLRKNVFISVSKVMSIDDKIVTPAITFCATNKETDLGWKNSELAYSGNVSVCMMPCAMDLMVMN